MAENQQIAVHDGSSRAVGLPVEQRASLLREALTNPAVDPTKASAVMDLIFRMEDRDRQAAFIDAKTHAIAAMPRIGKDGFNSNLKSHFSKWETMQPIVTRVLTQHGLAISFEMGDDGGKVTCRPILQGHGWIERGEVMKLPADSSGQGTGRNQLQAIGSAQSYARRYAAMAMLNLNSAGKVDQDDDGNAGGGTPEVTKLTADQQATIEAGRSAALGGTASYEEWFKALPIQWRGWLAVEGEHDRLKDAAAKAD